MKSMTLMSHIFIELLPSNSDNVKTTNSNKKAGPRRLALAQPQKYFLNGKEDHSKKRKIFYHFKKNYLSIGVPCYGILMFSWIGTFIRVSLNFPAF